MSNSASKSHSEKNSLVWARTVNANWHRSYDVTVVDDLLGTGIEELLRQIQFRNVLLVTTPTVAELYGRNLQLRLENEFDEDVPMLVLDCVENSKELWQVEKICAAASDLNMDRQAVLVALGGGVLTDLVTMAASWIRRGIGAIRIPTTLLGQVDGGVGVKGAVNFRNRKNWLGCYRSPESVLVDPAFLSTLEKDQIRHGLSEIIKIALVRDGQLFEQVEQHVQRLIDTRFSQPKREAQEIIKRSIELMLDELETNLYEDQSYERFVDFGHTFAPIIESNSGFQIPHGEAVAIDMSLSCKIGQAVGILSREDADRAISLIRDTGLPTRSSTLDLAACQTAISDAALHRGGSVNLVVPTSIGNASFLKRPDQISNSTLHRAFDSLPANNGAKLGQEARANLGLVFDVGGTNLRAAVYDPEAESIRQLTVCSTQDLRDHDATPQQAFGRLTDEMDRLATLVLEGKSPEFVSVAFAGPVTADGKALAAPTIWGDSKEVVDVLSPLRRLWPSTPVSVLNDVTAAGYRYLRNRSDDLCIVTVSSGIGNKVFIHGKPVTGPANRGGELGHLRVDASLNAIVCECGGRGHLGGIASGRGALQLAQQRANKDPSGFSSSLLGSLTKNDISRLTTIDLVMAFQKNDVWTWNLIRTIADYLGRALASIHVSIGVERFVIFGGFGLALGEHYRRLLVEFAAQHCWSVGQNWNRMIELGENDDLSGLLGAGRFATHFSKDLKR